MRSVSTGITAGLAAGLAMSLAMERGRRSGMLHKTLAENAEDWLDRIVDSRKYIGENGTRALEQANHLAAAAAFGVGYTCLREGALGVPAWGWGALYGLALYGINMVRIAPAIGLTEGERNAPAAIRAERLGLHVFYGVVTAMVADALNRRTRRRRVSQDSAAASRRPGKA